MEPCYYECGICDCYHRLEWNGDCREDAARFDPLQLDALHGRFGWTEMPMPETGAAEA